MKKLKIMLLSLLVLAVIGGTLAFNASSRFTRDYCTTNAVQDAQGNFSCSATPALCRLLIGATTTTQAIIVPFCATTKPANGCFAVQNCTYLSRFIPN